MKIKTYISLILIAVFSAGMFFFIQRTLQLEEKLEQASQDKLAIAAKLNKYERLVEIDALLLQGEYDTAIDSYHTSFDAAKEHHMAVPLRIALAEKLRNDNTLVEPVSNKEVVQQDSLPKTGWDPEIAVRKYDSLNFSLEKTKVQLARLKKQLQRKSYGEYLTFTTKKGNKLHYIGQVKNGKAHGFGVALLETGSRYEGEWVDNERHGEGTFYWPDGEYYVGNYINDKRSGFGTYYWPNGEKYTGEWKNDKRSGNGKFFDAEGDVVAGGEWNNDELVELNQRK